MNQHFPLPSAQVWRISLSGLKLLNTFESFHSSVTVRPIRPVEPVEPVEPIRPVGPVEPVEPVVVQKGSSLIWSSVYIVMQTHIYIYIYLPVVTHKAVAEVSKTVNL